MSSPVLLWSTTTTVFVDYHMFYLFDFESGSRPNDLLHPGGEWWSVSGTGGVILHSTLSGHDPTVTIQLFEGEPDPDTQDWERIETGEFSTTEPEISLACPTASPSDTTLTLHRSGEFHYRLHYRNPEGLTEVDMADESVDGSSEEYLIQLW